jgi:hypothetical protein
MHINIYHAEDDIGSQSRLLSNPLGFNNQYAELSVGNVDHNVYVGVIGGIVQIKVR